MMKDILGSIAVVLVLTASAFAQTGEGSPGNILQGNVATGGSISFTNDFPSDGYLASTLTDAFIPLEYFVIDRLSVGGNVEGYYSASGSSSVYSFGFGPAATYYFWSQGNLAALAGERFEYFAVKGASNYFSSSTRLGIEYFVTRSVALGPALSYGHSFQSGEIFGRNSLTAFASFNIYL